MEMNMTFPSDTSELLVHVGDKISFNVYEGKTAVFSKDDAKRMLDLLMKIIDDDSAISNTSGLNGYGSDELYNELVKRNYIVKRVLTDYEQNVIKNYNSALAGRRME